MRNPCDSEVRCAVAIAVFGGVGVGNDVVGISVGVSGGGGSTVGR